MSIPFTQFLMPDGRKKDVTIQRPADIEEKARAIISRGFAFEIEMLMTGAISMEIIRRQPPESKKDDRVIAHEICANGPAVPASVDKMVTTAAKVLKISP